MTLWRVWTPQVFAVAIAVTLLALAGCVRRAARESSAQNLDNPPGNVTIVPLGRDIFAAIRKEPLSLAVNANSLFVVNSDHVVVVDAQFTRAATLENLAALRRITSKPVRFLVNTHWHDDHVAGNQVYRDTFPDIRIIAHENTRTDLIEKGRPNRAQQLQFAGPAADRFDRLMKAGLGADSTRSSPAERAALSSAVRIVREYIAEGAGFVEVLPDSIFQKRLTLAEGGRTIELYWFGRGNTRGDVVAFLPSERVLSSGDLLVAPVPFAFNSYPTEWIGVLDSLRALSPRVIVPGHGGVMQNAGYLDTVQQMLQIARSAASEAVSVGLSADSMVRVVTLESLRDQVAGGEKWIKAMFDMFFRRPVLDRLHQELSATQP